MAENKELDQTALQRVPPRLLAVETQLSEAARRISRRNVRDPYSWFPIARASIRANLLYRDVQVLRPPKDWSKQQHASLASLRPRLPALLKEAGSLWSELTDFVRYAPRPESPSGGLLTPKSIRRLRESLRRERTWLSNKLWPRVAQLRSSGASVAHTIRGVRTQDSLPTLAEEVEEPVIVPPEATISPSRGAVEYAEYLRTRHYRVWFGTNRSLSERSDRSSDDHLTLGSCVVYVPRTHKFGSLGSSWLTRVLKRFVLREEDDRLRVVSTTVLKRAEFQHQISAELHKWRRRAALVILHGYNVAFEEAARRSAQIGFDLRIDGITAFFSWPSRANVLRYMHDEESVQIAEPCFFDFLATLARLPEVEEIHILAHSVGNRLLLRTVHRLSQACKAGVLRAPIGQIVLAASDVAVPLFLQHLPTYSAVANKRITSYSCTQDVPLRISRGLHAYDRVGLEPPIFVSQGVDSISAADLDLHALGHGYYADVEPVLYDIGDVLHNNTPPAQRMRLEPGPYAGTPPYWVFRP